MNDKPLVKTTDMKTAEYLRNAGFIELAKEGDKWVFLNCAGTSSDFSANSDLKLTFTNILCV